VKTAWGSSADFKGNVRILFQPSRVHRFPDCFHSGLARLDSRPARLRSFLNRGYDRTPSLPGLPTRRSSTPSSSAAGRRVLCTNGALTVERKAVETIKRLGIRIIETPIALLERAGDKLEGVRFTESSFLPRSAVFSPVQYQRSPLAEQLGCEFCEGNEIGRSEGAEST
jgi:hypothetical protein